MQQPEPLQSGKRQVDQSGEIEAPTLEGLIQERLPPEPSWDVCLAVYEEAFALFWAQLVPLMGHAGARAIFGRALQLTQRRHALAGTILVGEQGLDYGLLRGQAPRLEATALEATLSVFAQTSAGVIASLIGPALLLTLLADLKRALGRHPPGRVNVTEPETPPETETP